MKKNLDINLVRGCGLGIRLCMSTTVGAAAVAFLAVPNSAHSAIMTQIAGGSLLPLPTGYMDQQIGVQRFDASLGTLTSVEIILTGTGQMIQQFENRAASPSSIDISQILDLSLTLPGNGVMHISQTENHVYAPGPSDGNLDFGGTSGETHPYGVTASDHQLYTGDLSAFTGSGLVDLLLSANGAFQVSAFSGNLDLLVSGTTLAGADVSVVYSYDSISVPEPGSYGYAVGASAAALGLVGLVLTRSGSRKPRGIRQ